MPPRDPREWAKLARQAERLGFDSVWGGEHIVRPVAPSGGYPYGTGSHIQHYAIYDPFHLAVVAALSAPRLTVGVGVAILPLWEPSLFVRSVRTAALACDGRLVLGVGVGWWREEFEAMSAEFAGRGKRCDEVLKLMAGALADGVLRSPDGSVVGRLYDPSIGEPVTPPVELLIGGDSGAARRRAARFGGGWYSHRNTDDEMARFSAEIKAAVCPAPSGFAPGMWTVRVDQDIALAEVDGLFDLGVQRVVVSVGEKFEGVDFSELTAMIDATAARLQTKRGTVR